MKARNRNSHQDEWHDRFKATLDNQAERSNGDRQINDRGFDGARAEQNCTPLRYGEMTPSEPKLIGAYFPETAHVPNGFATRLLIALWIRFCEGSEMVVGV